MDDFNAIIRLNRPLPLARITSTEAARRLGVGVTAVKRWADAGLLPCTTTAGGHRRFDPLEVQRFRRDAPPGGDPWSRWFDALVERADVHLVLALLFEARAAHGAWHAAAGSLGELLAVIGERWARGDLSVAQEHVASSLLQRALTLAAETLQVPSNARSALLAPAEGDDHTLGLSLAELCLREHGWRAEWLGRPARAIDVGERIRGGHVQMAALSASAFMRDRRALRAQVRVVGSACQRAGIPLVLGGNGRWPDPPAFGVRLERWADFHQFIRRQR